MRAGHYLDQSVRRVSDDVAKVAAFLIGNDSLATGLLRKQREMSRFRQMIAHLVESGGAASAAIAPPRRRARKGG